MIGALPHADHGAGVLVQLKVRQHLAASTLRVSTSHSATVQCRYVQQDITGLTEPFIKGLVQAQLHHASCQHKTFIPSKPTVSCSTSSSGISSGLPVCGLVTKKFAVGTNMHLLSVGKAISAT